MTSTDPSAEQVRLPAYTVQILEDGVSADWDAFVAQHPRASIYHLSNWQRIIADVFGHQGHFLYARTGSGAVVGVLPLVRLRSRMFGDYLVSMPYVNYGGAVAASGALEADLVEHACLLAKELGVRHVEFRDDVSRPGFAHVRNDKVLMKLELPNSTDALWSMFGSKLRAQIKRPIKGGAVARRGGLELLDAFYGVFSRNMRDLGTPVYGKRFFERILREFPEQASLVSVEMKDKPVAAGFLVKHRDTVEIPWASTLRECNHISVNMLLYWESLQQAVESGARSFDFGRSSVDSGTYRFKQQWGAKPQQLFWHYWLKERVRMPDLTPRNPRYRLAVRLWQRMPLAMANIIGPRIVKNLP